MSKALHGKLLISICAGITVPYLESLLHHSPPTNGDVAVCDDSDDESCGSPVQIVRALPNTASLIQEGMTVIAESEPALPSATESLVTWIFRRIGDVVYLPTGSMDASTALVGSAPAFFLLMLEAAIDGAVAMGLPREEATRMAAQSMRGAAGLVLGGEHPATMRDRVATPGGCTIGGLMVLEEGGARGTMARAVREAAGVARLLGEGREAVNGTRFNYSQNGGF
jgi:pyrroline-5-carboxylate reductase